MHEKTKTKENPIKKHWEKETEIFNFSKVQNLQEMKRNLYTPNGEAWKYVKQRSIEMQEKLVIHSPWGGKGGINPKVNR